MKRKGEKYNKWERNNYLKSLKFSYFWRKILKTLWLVAILLSREILEAKIIGDKFNLQKKEELVQLRQSKRINQLALFLCKHKIE